MGCGVATEEENENMHESAQGGAYARRSNHDSNLIRISESICNEEINSVISK